MALDFTGMNNAQVEAYLRDLYAQGAGSIATQGFGDGVYRHTDSQGRDYQPYGDGWARQCEGSGSGELDAIARRERFERGCGIWFACGAGGASDWE